MPPGKGAEMFGFTSDRLKKIIQELKGADEFLNKGKKPTLKAPEKTTRGAKDAKGAGSKRGREQHREEEVRAPTTCRGSTRPNSPRVGSLCVQHLGHLLRCCFGQWC